MRINTIANFTKIPTQNEIADVVRIPSGCNAVVFHVITDSFESIKHGCTTHKDVWFPSPTPILMRQGKGDPEMIILVNSEVIKIPDEVKDFVVEFGVVTDSHQVSGLLK